MTSVSALPIDQLQQEITRLLALVGQKEETIQNQKTSIQNLQHRNQLKQQKRLLTHAIKKELVVKHCQNPCLLSKTFMI